MGMKIILDCDDVCLDSIESQRQFYSASFPNDTMPDRGYPSRFPAFKDNFDFLKKWLDDYTRSEYFITSAPVDGAVRGVRALKDAGHDLCILSCCSDNPEIRSRRGDHLARVFGRGVFDDVVCIPPGASKKDKMAELAGGALVDDGMSNIQAAIELGMLPILFRNDKVNGEFVDKMLSYRDGEPHILVQSFWKYDFKKVQGNAFVANNWNEIVSELTRFSQNAGR
jgi:hypothetical protein